VKGGAKQEEHVITLFSRRLPACVIKQDILLLKQIFD
jgi:hypothetical protein